MWHARLILYNWKGLQEKFNIPLNLLKLGLCDDCYIVIMQLIITMTMLHNVHLGMVLSCAILE